jgi:ATP-binding cassette subfamily C protein
MICDVIIAWTISWSFSLLNKKLTPKIIYQLVFSETAEAVKKQEATVVQRWLTIRQIAEFFHNVLANSLGSVFTLGILLWGTYGENIMAGHSLIIILLVWLVLLFIFSPKALKTSKYYAQMEENVGRNIRSSVSLSDSLKSREVFRRFAEKLSPNITAYSRSISLQGFYGSLLYGVLSGIASLAPLVVIIVAILSSGDNSVGITTAATLYLFASKITSPLASLARVIPILQSQRVDFIRFQSIYNNQSGEEQEEGNKIINDFKVIHIDGFKYRYDNSKEISFDGLSIEKGKITCLSGNSGAGKTTLLKIISGRLDNQVSVNLNGSVPLFLNDLADEIAYLPQEPKLAEMTVRENLDLHVIDGKIANQYCREAYNKIIAQLSDMEYTLITSDVIGLSVGQRRTLSVINTLSLNKPVIILDEPLANIDNELADLIWKAVMEEKSQKLILVALHDEKHKAECDVIINLN